MDRRAGAADQRSDGFFHQVFEARVAQTPDAVAVVFADRQLTYRELNSRANQLARRLQALDVGPETLVGLYMRRSPEMVLGILGILKAGGAWLPLDFRHTPLNACPRCWIKPGPRSWSQRRHYETR